MKKLIIVMCMAFLVGCSSTNQHDNYWDIDVQNIQKVEIQYMDYTFKTKEIALEDGICLIETFNEIAEEDIDYDKSGNDTMVGIRNAIVITTNEEVIKIGFDLWPVIITYKDDWYYYINMNHEFFDVIRDVCIKYDLNTYYWTDYFADNAENNGYGGFLFSDCIVTVDKTFNEVFERLNVLDRVDDSITIQGVLDTYDDLKLNDVVVYENVELKIIEILNGEVTTVVFHVNE